MAGCRLCTRLGRWCYDYGLAKIPSFSGSLAIVYLLVLSGLFRQNLLFALSLAQIGISLVLRPTSILVFSTTLAIGLILAHRLSFHRSFRLTCVLLTAAVIAGNLAILQSDGLAKAFYSIEPSVKEDLLEGHSNNDFRLGVLKAARDEMGQQSLLIGKAFSGDVGVDPLIYLPWVHEDEELTIHSDFVIMMLQGGLIGYGLLAALFVGMALLCAKAARIAQLARDSSSESVFDALQLMNVTFILFISPQPTIQFSNTRCLISYRTAGDFSGATVCGDGN